MDIRIVLGWWILPFLYTVLSWIWFRFVILKDGYAALAGIFFAAIWVISVLLAWLIYAATSAILNII